MLESATNVYGEEGSSQLARLVNVVGGDIDNIDRYASALTHLGNTSAATEREILRFATDMASRSQAFNISGQDAMGLAAAFKSVGLQSELASGAVSRVLGVMNEAIYSGGDALVIMSAISGKTQEQLKKDFETDAVGALVSLGDSVHDLEGKGVNLTKALNYLGLEGLRDKVVMTTLAKQIDLVKESMAASNKEFIENKALLKEYGVQTQTLTNRTKTAYGAFKLVLIAIVDKLDDKLKSFIDKAKDKLVELADYIEKTPLSDIAVEFGKKIKESLIWAFDSVKPYVVEMMEFAIKAFGNAAKNVMMNYIGIDSYFKKYKSDMATAFVGGMTGQGSVSKTMFGTPRTQSQSVELNGNITVSADKNSKVSTSNFGFSGNRGRILQTVGATQ
jgi:TP901 family phage tail tape measure protein